MGEIKNKPEIHEAKSVDFQGFQEIKPKTDMRLSEAKDFVEKLFNETKEKFGGYYVDLKTRLDCTPNERVRGEWQGERGYSKFIPSDETEKGKEVKEKLAEYKLDGIVYKNGEPDFSECALETVEIDKMTEFRHSCYDENGNHIKGNFEQANEKLADLWNKSEKDGKTDWDGSKVEDWRKNTAKCVWHERCDTRTMDLVPVSIHEYFRHSGGCAECKARDGGWTGDEFDE